MLLLSLVYTQESFPWTDNFSLSCELPCATNGFKTKEIFLSEENFPACKRALSVNLFGFAENLLDTLGLESVTSDKWSRSLTTDLQCRDRSLL